MIGSAVYGDGGEASSIYRYVLKREGIVGAEAPLNPGAALLIGLNPSTATANVNDPTITRETDFVRRWGYSNLWKCNAFGFRATDPEKMKLAIDPVGPNNDQHILELAAVASIIVICWGKDGAFRQRGYAIRKLLKGFDLLHFGKTKNGEPKHPLYLKATTPLERWT